MRRLLPLLLILLFTLLPGSARATTAPAETPSGSASTDPLLVDPVLPLPPGAELVAESPRFRFVAFPDASRPARALSGEAEGLRNLLEQNLGQDYPGRTEVRVAMSRTAFNALQPGGHRAPSWAVGLAYPGLDLIVLDASARGGHQPPKQVLLHELSHIALDRLAPRRFPRWFLEGMAIYHAAEIDPGRYATLATATLRGDHLPLDELEDGWPDDPVDVQLAYAQAVDFVGWLFREHGQRSVHRLVEAVREGSSFDDALEVGTGLPLWKLEKLWHEDLRVRFTWVPLLASGGTLWTATSLLFLLAYWRRRRQARAGFRRMELEEQLLAGGSLAPDQLEELDALYAREDGDPPLESAEEDDVDDADDPDEDAEATPDDGKMPYLH